MNEVNVFRFCCCANRSEFRTEILLLQGLKTWWTKKRSQLLQWMVLLSCISDNQTTPNTSPIKQQLNAKYWILFLSQNTNIKSINQTSKKKYKTTFVLFFHLKTVDDTTYENWILSAILQFTINNRKSENGFLYLFNMLLNFIYLKQLT